MTYAPHGPLQDPINMTPLDLLFLGIEIVEVTPNYFAYRYRGKGHALHDTPTQAIWHARKTFGVREDEE